MAHALTGHDGPCRNIHGHSYRLSVTIVGKPIIKATDPKSGMVMDFSDLKKIVESEITTEFDHALVLNESDRQLIKISDPEQRVIYLPFAPTCEMLLGEFQRRISAHLPAGVKLFAMRLDETATSYTEWYLDDNL